jgi:hypothetical protein
MALNKTLGTLVEELRNEIGASTNLGQGVNQLPALQQTIRRTQERLWAEYAWPHLVVDRDEDLQGGSRVYDFTQLKDPYTLVLKDPNDQNSEKVPKVTSDLSPERVIGAWVKYANVFEPIGYGFNPTIYSASNSELGFKSDPVQLWRRMDGNQYEVWPMPSGNTAQTIRFRGIRNLNPLLGTDDTADLDDTLIVLFAAAEILTRLKSEDAQVKVQMAQSHYRNLRGNLVKRDMFILGNGLPRDDRGDWVIRVNPI